MLKIKDDIDLKELEKFGFKKQVVKQLNPSPIATINRGFYENIEWHLDCEYGGIEIHEKRNNNHWRYGFEIRELNIWANDDGSISDEVYDVLFDLISSGLVEKL